MKKLVLASAMALASVAFVASPALRAQNSPAQGGSGQLTISDPAEYNAYQQAASQADPAAKASALEQFLTQYPNTVVKKAVLDSLIDTYQGANNPEKALDAAGRLLQLDPNNFKAIFYSVFLKKQLCQKSVDPATGDPKDTQSCDDAAALSQKGLSAPKPDGVDDANWKKMTDASYPAFHSAIALDDVLSKKDYAAAIKEYTTELMLYSPQQTQTGPGLVDTLSIAEAYAKPGDSRDPVKACWFYARAWDFAPAGFKPQIQTKLEYWYKRYHGTLDSPQQITDQINAIKQQAQATLFPPSTFAIAPAPKPADLAHAALTNGDPKSLNLEDKEFILANGNQADAQQLWGLLQGQMTPVPGIVINADANALIVTIPGATPAAKGKDYTVKLNTPAACAAVPPVSGDAKAYLQANGNATDIAAIPDLDKAKKIEVAPGVSVINVAVTQDAKDSKSADFTVNLKEPVSCKEAPAPGTEAKTQPGLEIDGTYDTYTTTPAQGSTAAKAQIVLKEGFVQAEKKAGPAHRPGAPVHKPAAAHPGM